MNESMDSEIAQETVNQDFPKGELESSQEFIGTATPYQQVEACYRTLVSLTDAQNGYLKGHKGIHEWRDSLSQALLYKENLNCDPNIAARIVHATVLFLDIALIDFIAPTPETNNVLYPPGSNERYYRDTRSQKYLQSTQLGEGIESIIPLTISEANTLYKGIYRGSIVQTIEEIKKVLDDQTGDKGIMLGSSITNEQLVQIRSLVCEDAYSQRGLTVHVPIRLGQLIIMMQINNSNTLDHIDNIYEPLSYVPLQDIWVEFLRHGIPLYPTKNAIDPLNDHESRKSFNEIISDISSNIQNAHNHFPDSVRLIRKYRSALESQRSCSQAEDQHGAYYARVFGREHVRLGKPKSLITRSGVSANETALLAATAEVAKTLQNEDTANIYFHDGWYYENLVTRAKDPFRIFENDEMKAHIICINHNPTVSYPGGILAYEKSIHTLIERTIARAQKEPLKRFVIIYDKTTDLNASVIDSDNVPENISIYETMSLSKHQRGDRSGFYGVLLHWGLMTQDELKAYRTKSLGEPTAFTIATFPFVSPHDIRRTIEHNNELTEVMLSIFNDPSLNLNKPWLVEPYNYFAYILPPLEVIVDDMLRGWMREDGYIDVNGQKKSIGSLTQEDRKYLLSDDSFLLSFRLHVKNIVDDTLKAAIMQMPEGSSIHRGDSFGLNASRLGMLLNAKIPYENNDITLTLPRFAFGRHTTNDQIKRYFTKVLELYNKYLTEQKNLYQEYLDIVKRFGKHVTYY